MGTKCVEYTRDTRQIIPLAAPFVPLIAWAPFLQRLSQVEAPFLPKVQGGGDTSNFESYPESVDDDSPPLSAEESALFEELENF